MVKTGRASGPSSRIRQLTFVVVLLALVGCGLPMGLDGRTALDGKCSQGRPDGLSADDLVGTWQAEKEQAADVRRILDDVRPAPFELRPRGKMVVTFADGKKLAGTWKVTKDDGNGHDLELKLPDGPSQPDAPHGRLWVIKVKKKYFIYNLLGDPDACHTLWYARIK